MRTLALLSIVAPIWHNVVTWCNYKSLRKLQLFYRLRPKIKMDWLNWKDFTDLQVLSFPILRRNISDAAAGCSRPAADRFVSGHDRDGMAGPASAARCRCTWCERWSLDARWCRAPGASDVTRQMMRGDCDLPLLATRQQPSASFPFHIIHHFIYLFLYYWCIEWFIDSLIDRLTDRQTD